MRPEYDLNSFSAKRDVSRLYLLFWRITNAIVFSDLFPLYGLRRFALRCFGAKIGRGVILRTGILVYNPRNLFIGHGAWVGERCNISNPAPLYIAGNVAIAHEVFFACGSHDFNSSDFATRHSPIKVGAGSWVASRSILLPNTRLWRCVVGAGVVVPGKTYSNKVLKLASSSIDIVERKNPSE